MMALWGGRGGQKKSGNTCKKEKQQRAQAAKEAEAKTQPASKEASCKMPRPKDEVTIVKASKAPDNTSADWLGKRSGKGPVG